MRVKLPNILSLARIARFALTPLYFWFVSFPSWAQEINFQDSIDASSEALIALDVKASDCLAALDAGDDPQSLCTDFMAAIDGELMANYLAQCRLLKGWRDEYVDKAVASALDADSENNEEMLRRLVSIEFVCGGNTLQNRTQFVVIAFNQLRGGSIDSASVDASAAAISGNRFNALENSERERLQNSLRNQQDRSQRESQQQFNDLENELIRQQIQNSNRPN